MTTRATPFQVETECSVVFTKVGQSALREIAKKATPGPWKLTGQHMTIFWRVWIGGHHMDASPADAAFIATFNPATVLTLLDEIDRLKGLTITWEQEAEKYRQVDIALRSRIEELEKE